MESEIASHLWLKKVTQDIGRLEEQAKEDDGRRRASREGKAPRRVKNQPTPGRKSWLSWGGPGQAGWRHLGQAWLRRIWDCGRSWACWWGGSASLSLCVCHICTHAVPGRLQSRLSWVRHGRSPSIPATHRLCLQDCTLRSDSWGQAVKSVCNLVYYNQ